MTINDVYIKYLSAAGSQTTNDGFRVIKSLPFLSVVQSTEGSYEIGLDGSDLLPTGEGGFFIAPAIVTQRIIHRVNPSSKRMCFRWLFIDAELNGGLKLDRAMNFPMILRGDGAKSLEKSFNSVFNNDPFERMSNAYSFLRELIKFGEFIDRRSDERIRRAIKYAEENYALQISVAELASVACMSEANFYLLFKKETGKSPVEYLTERRLSIASNLLLSSDRSVGEISDKTGFCDQFYFSRKFKSRFGVSPLAYRISYRNRIND